MKITSKVFAGIFAAAVMATTVATVSAADYSKDADYGKPAKGSVASAGTVEDAVALAKAQDKMTVVLSDTNLSGAGVLQVLQTLNRAVKINATGYTLNISADDVKNAKEIKDLTMGFTNITEATKIAGGVEIPKDSTYVVPATDGAFGVSVKVEATVSKAYDKDKVKFYHIYTQNGKTVVEEISKGVTMNGNKATFTISSASSYVITEGTIEGAKAASDSSNSSSKPSGGTTEPSPNTGVTLPIALVALAGGSVAVSAIVAKKRK
ncbi:MAG: hypothetical protein J1F03_01965 [Oscillospiraceae bacterium]|nr:hypothetical protein [Oscillospiraceae bacterium]